MPKESLSSKQQRALHIFEILKKKNPTVTTFLTHKNPFELLIAVILSAQCTDERVNKVTPNLFYKANNPYKMDSLKTDQIYQIFDQTTGRLQTGRMKDKQRIR